MKKLEALFSVFLVVVLVVPNLSFGAWVGPSGSFSILSPDPELPLDQGSLTNSKPGTLELKNIDFSPFESLNPIFLDTLQSINYKNTINKLFFVNGGLFNVSSQGLILPKPSVAPTTGVVAGTIYYDSTTKEVKLHDGSDWKSIGSGMVGGSTGVTNPLKLEYTDPSYGSALQNWSLTAKPQDGESNPTKGPVLEFTNTEGNGLPTISIEDKGVDYGAKSLLLNTGTRLCFNNGKNPSTDCKSAWPTAQQSGSSQWKDLTGGIYYNSGSVSIGSNEPKAALRISGGTNQLYIDSDTGTYLDGAGGGYNQSEPIVFHVGGAQLIARNADFDGANWKRAKYGTVSAIAFGGGDERNDAPAGDIQFLTAPYGDAGSNIGTFKNVLSIKNNGNVGIGGEPDSKYKFDVKSGYINLGDASSEVMIPGGATLDEGLLVRSGGLIVSGGNVGIGTDSPKEKLHVSKGNILVQSGHVLFETFQPADPQAISVFSLSGSGSLTGSNITYTATYGSEFGETQAAPTPTFGTVNPNNGKVKITLNEPVDPRITHYYVYRSTNGNSGPFFLIKKLEISKLEKEGSYYVYTDSGDTITLPPKNPPPYSTFAAGFQLKSEQDSSYTQILRMMKTNNGSVFMGINTDRPSELFEVVGVGSTPVRALDPTGGKIGRIRITDTLNNPELQLQYGTNPTDHWGIYVNRDLDSGGPALQFWAGGNNALTVYQSGVVSASYSFSSNRIIGTNLTAQNANLVNLNFDNAQTGGKKVYSIMGGGGCGNYSVRETCYSFGSGSLDPGILDKGACSVGNIQYLTKPYNNVAQFVFLCMY